MPGAIIVPVNGGNRVLVNTTGAQGPPGPAGAAGPAGGQIVQSEHIGPSPPATAAASSDVTIVELTPVASPGQLKTIQAYMVSGGSLKVRACTVSGGNFTFKGPTITLTGVSGLNTWNADDGDFAALDLLAGDRLGFYAGTRLASLGSGGSIFAVSGDTTANNSSQASSTFSSVVQIAFDIERVSDFQIRPLSQAEYDALATKDSATLYVIV